MALLAVQSAVAAGIVPTYNAASTSDTFVDDGSERTFVHIKNTNGSQRTATVVPPQATANQPGVGPYTVPTMSVIIPATTGDKMIGPFPSAYINQATGLVTLTLDASAGVTTAVVKVPKTS
jgi:hypothetical protein